MKNGWRWREEGREGERERKKVKRFILPFLNLFVAFLLQQIGTIHWWSRNWFLLKVYDWLTILRKRLLMEVCCIFLRIVPSQRAISQNFKMIKVQGQQVLLLNYCHYNKLMRELWVSLECCKHRIISVRFLNFLVIYSSIRQ